jgi:hypothetical protein
MKFSSQKIYRLAIASALGAGLVSVGVAASAQTTDEAAMMNQATATSAATTQTMGATNVSLSSLDSKVERQTEFERAAADEHRRMLFRNQGTSL